MGRKTEQEQRSERAGRWRGPGPEAGREGLKAKRHFTPEERRQAVEAFEKSGLTQKAFAGQWGVSHVTLGQWVRRYVAEGPKGLERLAAGPKKRRGKAPLSEALKQEIVAARTVHAGYGWKRLTAWLWRFGGVKVSPSSVRRVSKEAGLEAKPAPKRRRSGKAKPPRRFERSRPGELWQSDITYLEVAWRRGPLYLIVFLDDFSRYVVGFGLYTHQRATIALETFEAACARFGRPSEVLTDQGRQYYAWRGKSLFQKLLAKLGIRHVVARAQHPETVGKCERLWESVKKELWERVSPKDLEEAQERLGQYFAHYNHQRPHQSLDGMVPADRFFGVEDEVRRAIEETVAKNAIRLALGEAPRKPLFLVGQIDGQAVSLHGESGRIVVQTPDGVVKEISTKDLGMGPGPGAKEVRDGKAEEGRDEGGVRAGGAVGGGGDGAGLQRAGDPAAGDPAASPAAPPGAQANGVSGADPDAGTGSGAVEGGQPGGEDAGPPDGGDGAEDMAGQEQP